MVPLNTPKYGPTEADKSLHQHYLARLWLTARCRVSELIPSHQIGLSRSYCTRHGFTLRYSFDPDTYFPPFFLSCWPHEYLVRCRGSPVLFAVPGRSDGILQQRENFFKFQFFTSGSILKRARGLDRTPKGGGGHGLHRHTN